MLLGETKRFEAENEISLAEGVRRGLEDIIRHHPTGRTEAASWVLPQAYDLGAALVPEEEWTAFDHRIKPELIGVSSERYLKYISS